MFRLNGSAILVLTIHLVLAGFYNSASAGPTFTVTPKPKFTAEDLNNMNSEELNTLIDELSVHWKKLSVLANRKDNASNNDGVLALKALRPYGLIEDNAEITLGILAAEMKRFESGNHSPTVFVEAFNTLKAVASSVPADHISTLRTLRAKLNPHSSNKFEQALYGFFGQTINIMAINKQAPANIREALKAADLLENGLLKRTNKLEEYLNSTVIGQPEVVDLILNLEFKSRLYGEVDSKPSVLYVMGLPGTGKDTIVRAWVNGIHDEPEAHKKHLFSLPIMKDESDLWKVLGSSTGYKGSDAIPPFLEFLVLHSNGKYKFEQVSEGNGKVSFKIIENPDYKGDTLPGYFPPESAVVFANEFHNWSRSIKDDFLKQALEHGYFSINNPNGGLAEIYVPVRFFVASNEGLSLLAAREANGQRYGKSLSYEEVLKKWERYQGDKNALKSAILATNGSANDPVGSMGKNQPGTSEELLNRIPERNILLLRPLSPEDLRKIAEMDLQSLSQKLHKGSRLFESLDLYWSEELVEFVQSYHYNAEENARPILGRVLSLVEEPLIEAFRKGVIETGKKLEIYLSTKLNDDGTRSLIISVTYPEGEKTQFERIITETLQDRTKPALTDERIDELSMFSDRASREVFGVEGITERLQDRILSIANELTAGDVARPVNAIGVFGLTSTGKTELAKKTAKGILGNESDLLTLDFSQIQTLHDFKTRILGIKDARGNAIASDFMKAYDRNNGLVVVAADEISNVRDPELLKALYDFFREPIVTTFSDGKERPMGGVFVIITGNAGQEVYAAVPNDIPEEIKMAAWKKISDRLSNDVNLQAQVLEKYLPAPLIARIGKNNIFFVPPHTYRSLRQLTQLKLNLALKRIADSQSRRGWKVVFGSEQEYARMVDIIIDEGFSLRQQGASIDGFVRNDFESALNALLLKNKVSSGSTVVLELKELTDNSSQDKNGSIIYNVYVDGFSEPLKLELDRPHRTNGVKDNDEIKMLTAFHEAGHSITRQALFADSSKPVEISIVPGVSIIGGEWVYYAGVAINVPTKEVNQTRDWVVRQIAVLLGGETAERLVSKGSVHSIGKSNDIKRATQLAYDAVLTYGLSEKWGVSAIPAKSDMQSYIATLSDERKRLLETEVEALINEGRAMAQSTLEANYSTALIPLGIKLVEQGVVREEELAAFYAEHKIVSGSQVPLQSKVINSAVSLWRSLTQSKAAQPDSELLASIPKPSTIADIEAIARKEKLEMYSTVPMPEDAPIGTNESYRQAKESGGAGCRTLLLPPP